MLNRTCFELNKINHKNFLWGSYPMKDKVCETKKGLGPLVYETYGHGSLIIDSPCHLSNPVQLGTN